MNALGNCIEWLQAIENLQSIEGSISFESFALKRLDQPLVTHKKLKGKALYADEVRLLRTLHEARLASLESKQSKAAKLEHKLAWLVKQGKAA